MSRAILQNPDYLHVALLRSLADRLEAVGSSTARTALDELSASTEAHLTTVEATIALVEALEASAPIH